MRRGYSEGRRTSGVSRPHDCAPSSGIRHGFAEELHEARERILDRAEAVLYEALFSDDPKRRNSAAQFILTKSQCGRARFHALTDHLQLDPNADRPTIRWSE